MMDTAPWSYLDSGFRSNGSRNNLTQPLCDVILSPLSHSVQSRGRFITSVHADSNQPPPLGVSSPMAFTQEHHRHLPPDLLSFSAQFLVSTKGLTRHWTRHYGRSSLWEVGFSFGLRHFLFLSTTNEMQRYTMFFIVGCVGTLFRLNQASDNNTQVWQVPMLHIRFFSSWW
jgi:hypothetical protein